MLKQQKNTYTYKEYSLVEQLLEDPQPQKYQFDYINQLTIITLNRKRTKELREKYIVVLRIYHILQKNWKREPTKQDAIKLYHSLKQGNTEQPCCGLFSNCPLGYKITPKMVGL